MPIYTRMTVLHLLWYLRSSFFWIPRTAKQSELYGPFLSIVNRLQAVCGCAEFAWVSTPGGMLTQHLEVCTVSANYDI
jgi:hypothetical protein